MEFEQEVPQVIGDAKQLEIVFINLIKNGLEAVQAGAGTDRGQLRISLWSEADVVKTSVYNSGPGIAPTILASLFKPHFTTKGSHGTGIGLYLCRQIVRGLGGTIEIKTDDAEGTTFIVLLKSYPRDGTISLQSDIT